MAATLSGERLQGEFEYFIDQAEKWRDATDDDDEDEGGEQNMEDEANKMLRSWNREQLFSEISEDYDKIQAASENKNSFYYDGDTDFDEIAKKMTPLKGEQVYIEILEPNPAGKQINGSQTIYFDRIGYLEYDLTPFESSIYDGKPSKMSLKEGPIIPGLLQGLISMREGERANILIRPSMAYGRLGSLPLIPEDASLFYHVKVHKVWDESQLNEVFEHERHQMMDFDIPLERKLALVEEHKEIANTYLRDDMPREALIRYKAAIKYLDDIGPEVISSNRIVSKLMVTLLQNATITFNRLGMHKSATKTARRALFMDTTNIKLYYQLVKARIGVGDYASAQMYIDKADKLSPNNASFDQLRLQMDFKRRDEKRKMDDIAKKMSRAYV